MRLLQGIAVCAFACALSFDSDTNAADRVYQGTWNTTNRKLDGTMTCVVSEMGVQKWKGRFYGVWQGVPFDYTVNFAGTPDQLRGVATIDGAHYDWQGALTDDSRFTGRFGGTRYTGYFDLTRSREPAAAKPRER
jgi:hypothetical protein